jgi:hypothetical protein
MAEGHAQRHQVEFGGSPVGTEFDGKLAFKLVDRVPIFTTSHEFTAHTARQIRYALVSTWGPERPFYQRYQWVAIDVRMVTGWEPGAPGFLAQLRDRLRQLGGDLVLVAYDTSALPGEFATAETVEAAVEQVHQRRDAARALMLGAQ